MMRIVVALIILGTFFTSCRSTKKIQTALVKKDTTQANVLSDLERARLDSIAFIKEQYTQLQSRRIQYTTFSAKLDVDYEDGTGQQLNLNAQLRMYKDSLIWASITAILGIEGLRAYITRDSVKLLDKQNKIYIARSVAYLTEVTALPLDLGSLQDLLIGNPVFLDSTLQAYSKGNGTISLQGVNSFFRLLFTIAEQEKVLLSTKFDDLDLTRNRTSFLGYAEYDNRTGINFSQRRNIAVSEKKKLNVELRFKQYAFNETLSFPFSIPKNYRRG
ncbi:MAG: DUF4292 domain-containing protein [Bacteroidetes bacterium]|nr:DUF4292 domain-containing protein [Bacteroidota bacterium]